MLGFPDVRSASPIGDAEDIQLLFSSLAGGATVIVFTGNIGSKGLVHAVGFSCGALLFGYPTKK